MTKDEFFDNIVFGQIKHDLENMLNVKPLGEFGGLNYPLVNSVVNYMHFFGTLIEGKDKNNCGKYLTKLYIDLCMYKYKEILDEEILWNLARNGCSHDYFSRVSISKEPNIDCIAYLDNKKDIIINSYILTKLFIESFIIFKDRLDETTFASRMIEIKNLVSKKNNNLRMEDYKSALLKYQNNKLIIPTSGASTNPYLNQN